MSETQESPDEGISGEPKPAPGTGIHPSRHAAGRGDDVLDDCSAHSPEAGQSDKINQRNRASLASEAHLGPAVPVVVRTLRVNLEKLERSGVLTPRSRSYQLAEELRVIKRRLLINAAGLGEDPIENGNLIMITSSGPGEGKTFLSANLAVSIEMEIDHTVLLVDCDTARAGISHLFGVEAELGLSDLLMRSDLSLADVLIDTDIDDLSILPAGSKTPHINEQMASRKMVNLMRELSSRYEDRIIVFDSPPLLATTESSVLARLVGQIVFVVAAGQTKQSDLITALEQLDLSKVSGLVVNKSPEHVETAYYGSYYGSERRYLEF